MKSRQIEAFAGLGILGFVVFIVLLIALGPIATIAALNLLFNLSIPYTFWTWCGTLWLSAIVYGRVSSK